ncbi:MAG: adenylyl-sulfate kinase [Nitrososphaerota archaeon]|nr:adenylyl-sulfate kinase [Nitrososphaerota archaeon]
MAKVLARNGGGRCCRSDFPLSAVEGRGEGDRRCGQVRGGLRPRPAPRREKRDPKGLYARARRGEITNMTGIQDPYEEPTGPDLVVDTSESTPEASVNELVAWLRRPSRSGDAS